MKQMFFDKKMFNFSTLFRSRWIYFVQRSSNFSQLLSNKQIYGGTQIPFCRVVASNLETGNFHWEQLNPEDLVDKEANHNPIYYILP